MKNELSAFIIDDDYGFIDLFASVYWELAESLGFQPRLCSADCYTGELAERHYDVAFLDIQMPELSGFEISRILPHSDTRVVYVSAFDYYVFESFDYRAYGFVRKHQLLNDLYRVLLRYCLEQNNTIEIMINGKILPIDIDRIWLISVNGNYTTIYFDEFTSKIKVSLQRFEAANIKQLEYNFAHISRHMIVNLKCVERVQGNQVFMNKGSALYMSRGYAAKFRERYYTYRNRYAL